MGGALLAEKEDTMKQGAMASTVKAVMTKKVHNMVGDMGHKETREICDQFGQAVTKQGYRQCVSCGKAKAKQLTVAQKNEEHEIAGPEGHCMFLDIISVKHGPEKKKLLTKPYWLMMVVEQVNFKIMEFLTWKKGLPVLACNMIRNLQMKGCV
jgi:hypothetical protein